MPRPPLTLKEIKARAKAKGIKLLSNAHAPGNKLRLECSKGHRWLWPKEYISSKPGCPKCGWEKSGLKKRHSIEKIKSLAISKGGMFLSKTYRIAHHPYRWRCANGHQWKASVGAILRGGWCPYCSDGSGEECVRICFERVFKRKFPKAWPAWLEGISGTRLELDGFNPRLKMAFEHQGEHHYQRVSYFQNRRRFAKQIANDQKKSRLCRKHGVRLVKIPQINLRLRLEKLLPEVIRRCRQLGIRVPAGASRLRINYAPAWRHKNKQAEKLIKRLKAVAKKKGGCCLDQKWHGSKSSYRFRCSRGHEWNRTASGVMMGSWCLRCQRMDMPGWRRDWWRSRAGDRFRRKILDKGNRLLDRIRKEARRRGGDCISKKWIGWRFPYRFQCGVCGRKWTTHLQNFLVGTWCKSCGLRKWHSAKGHSTKGIIKRRSPA